MNTNSSNIISLPSKTRTTKKKLCSLLKLLILVACIGGFGYQITEFITYFYTYPTMVEIKILKPNYFIPPAVTVCNLSPIKRSDFCQRYSQNCEYLYDVESFCASRPHYCIYENMTEFMVPINPNTDFEHNETNRRIIDELVSQDSFVWPKETSYLNRLEYEGPFFLDSPLPCFIQHTRAFTNEAPLYDSFGAHLRVSRMDRSTQIGTSIINVNASEIFDYMTLPGVLMTLHSPFNVRNPANDGVLLTPGKRYKVHIRLEENHLLELPYKTDCRKYYQDYFHETNRAGPRSQQVCINSCWNTYNLECFGCSKPLMKPKLEAICVAFTQAYCDKYEAGIELKNCLLGCKAECTERKYIYRVEEQPYIQEGVELFSYVGGFLGCWLGISIWSSSASILDIPTEIKNRMKKIAGEKKNCHVSPKQFSL